MRKFGIEIECEISEAAALRALGTLSSEGIPVATRANGYHDGRSYTTWRVEYDSSVNRGVEIVSPVLEGENGLEQIRKVVKALSQAGGNINRTCGLHVHVAAQDLSGQWLKNLMQRYSDNQDAIDAFMPRSRREGGYSTRQFCQRITSSVAARQFTRASSVSDVRACFYDRYVVLNLQPLARLGTVEFRQHSGSLNAEKIINWVGFCQQFIEASKPVETRTTVRQTTRQSVSEDHGIPVPDANSSEVSLVGLTPKRKLLVQALIDAGDYGRTKGELARASGFSEGSVIATISYLRSQRGLQVRKRQGFYILSTSGAGRRVASLPGAEMVAIEQAPLASLWAGIDPTVVQFYAERTAELGPNG